MKTATAAKPQAKKNETPLNRQYNQIKAKYPGALLLFRVGDFYETFGEDAVRASKILGITLTKRNNGGLKNWPEIVNFDNGRTNSGNCQLQTLLRRVY